MVSDRFPVCRVGRAGSIWWFSFARCDDEWSLCPLLPPDRSFRDEILYVFRPTQLSQADVVSLVSSSVRSVQRNVSALTCTS